MKSFKAALSMFLFVTIASPAFAGNGDVQSAWAPGSIQSGGLVQANGKVVQCDIHLYPSSDNPQVPTENYQAVIPVAASEKALNNNGHVYIKSKGDITIELVAYIDFDRITSQNILVVGHSEDRDEGLDANNNYRSEMIVGAGDGDYYFVLPNDGSTPIAIGTVEKNLRTYGDDLNSSNGLVTIDGCKMLK